MVRQQDECVDCYRPPRLHLPEDRPQEPDGVGVGKQRRVAFGLQCEAVSPAGDVVTTVVGHPAIVPDAPPAVSAAVARTPIRATNGRSPVVVVGSAMRTFAGCNVAAYRDGTLVRTADPIWLGGPTAGEPAPPPATPRNGPHSGPYLAGDRQKRFEIVDGLVAVIGEMSMDASEVGHSAVVIQAMKKQSSSRATVRRFHLVGSGVRTFAG